MTVPFLLKMLVISLLGIAWLPPAFSSQAIYRRSNCGPGDPKLGMQMSDLSPWLLELDKRIKEHPGYVKLASKFEKNRRVEFATCVFRVNEAGDIVEANIHFSSGSPGIDRRFVAVIRNLGQLSPPVNSLPIKRGVEVSLIKIHLPQKTIIGLNRELAHAD